MNEDREKHLKDLISAMGRRIDQKYRAGQREHGGDLWTLTPLQLVDEAIDECIDQYTYLQTIRQQLTGLTPTEGERHERP